MPYHEIEKRTRTQTTYQVRVRPGNGSSRVSPARNRRRGHPVVLQGKGFRVADEGTMPQAQQPHPSAPVPDGFATRLRGHAAVSGGAGFRARPPPCGTHEKGPVGQCQLS